ncbi:uncharacterized protein [Arachis hypogaea]|uniref:uncharacterized protein n=1 Tax=Arachis hypogaea TaxID=3818 RepID=UPI003B21D217
MPTFSLIGSWYEKAFEAVTKKKIFSAGNLTNSEPLVGCIFSTATKNPYSIETLTHYPNYAVRLLSWLASATISDPLAFTDDLLCDISSGIDLHRRHLLQRRFHPVSSPAASSPCRPLCLLCQNRQRLPLRRSRSAARDCIPQERNSFVNFQAKTGVENAELCLVLLDRWILLIKLSFYNNSFSSYETSLQEGNYRGHKLPHSPTFVLIIRSYIRYVIYEVFIDHGVIVYA